jgi:hypothetical protein
VVEHPTRGVAPGRALWLVGSGIAVITSFLILYVVLLFVSLGAGATLGGFGEAAREPTAAWFGPAALSFVVVWLACVVGAVVRSRRHLGWLGLPFVALALLGVVGILLSRWWPA